MNEPEIKLTHRAKTIQGQRTADEIEANSKLNSIMGQVKAKYEAKLALLPTKEEADHVVKTGRLSIGAICNICLDVEAKLKAIARGS